MAEIKWDAIGNILAMFAVLSVFFEMALAPIFNWRFFVRRWEGKGVKTPITIVVAALLFYSMDLNVFKEIMVAFGKTDTASTGIGDFVGKLVTSFLIAGGSGGVFNIYTKLGMRNPFAAKQKAEEARAEAAQKAKAKAEEQERAQQALKEAVAKRETAEREAEEAKARADQGS